MKKKLQNVIIPKLFSATIILAVLLLLQSCGLNNTQKKLEEVATEVSKRLPMDLGSGLKWTKAEALPNKVFKYSYVWENLEVAAMDTAAFKKEQEPTILETIKSEPSLKYFRDNDVVMEYDYNDKNGKPAYTITIAPEMYKSKK